MVTLAQTTKRCEPEPPPAEQLSLSAATRRLPELCIDGEPVSVATLSRWASRGRASPCGRRVKLRTMLVGSRRVTTAEWVRDFLRRLNDEPAPQRNHQDDADVDAELDAVLG